jgi:cell division protein FtsL
MRGNAAAMSVAIDTAHVASRRERPAAGRRSRALRTESAERARALLRTAVFSVALLALMFAAVVYVRAQTAEFQHQKAELQQEIEMQQILKQQLEAEVAALTSPDRIRTIAVEKLGMVEPANVNYIIFERARSDHEDAGMVAARVGGAVEKAGRR